MNSNNLNTGLWGVTLTYNEEKMIPYVMPYYERLGYDKLIVYDNMSTDNTVELLKKYPFVEIRTFDTEDTFDDNSNVYKKLEAFSEIAAYMNSYYEECWLTVSDFDEVIYFNCDDMTFKEWLYIKAKEKYTGCNKMMIQPVLEKFPDTDDLVHRKAKKAILWDSILDENYKISDQCPKTEGEKLLLVNMRLTSYLGFTGGCHCYHAEFYNGVQEKKLNDCNEIEFFHLKYIDRDFVFEKAEKNIVRWLRYSTENAEIKMSRCDYEKYNSDYDDWLANGIDIQEYLNERKTKIDVKLYGVTLTYNEEKMIPYVMPYYERLGYDKLIVYDNMSTDNTVELLKKYPFVEVRTFDTNGVFDEDIHLDKKLEVFTEVAHNGEQGIKWITVTDFDEVLYYKWGDKDEFKKYLNKMSLLGYTAYDQMMIQPLSLKFPPLKKGVLAHEQIKNACYWYIGQFIAGKKLTLFRVDRVSYIEYSHGCHSHRIDPYDGYQHKYIDDNSIVGIHLKYMDFDTLLEKTKRADKTHSVSHQVYNCYSRNNTIEKLQRNYLEKFEVSFPIKDYMSHVREDDHYGLFCNGM